MSVEEHLSGFAPAEPPDGLRERVLALADRPPRPVLRAWWPAVAAALVIAVSVFVNHRVETGLRAQVEPRHPSGPRADQPYGPSVRPPVSPRSWVTLRGTLAKEMS